MRRMEGGGWLGEALSLRNILHNIKIADDECRMRLPKRQPSTIELWGLGDNY